MWKESHKKAKTFHKTELKRGRCLFGIGTFLNLPADCLPPTAPIILQPDR